MYEKHEYWLIIVLEELEYWLIIVLLLTILSGTIRRPLLIHNFVLSDKPVGAHYHVINKCPRCPHCLQGGERSAQRGQLTRPHGSRGPHPVWQGELHWGRVSYALRQGELRTKAGGYALRQGELRTEAGELRTEAGWVMHWSRVSYTEAGWGMHWGRVSHEVIKMSSVLRQG